MKLILDASVIRLTHESITNFASLSDFDKKSIQFLPSICNNVIPTIEADATNNITTEASISEASISSI